ncbi:hypothetical protein [Delftia sp. DLF01]|uniref:hypothetical protein n=1 Tax=Delftia sp. DLF01 TaxID=2769279 RepID=UPI001CE17876|nr:hypothetical protein [Delftia sp. DLF01]
MKDRSLSLIRKSLIWSIPSFLLMLIISIWSIKYSLLETIYDLRNLSPTIRITPSDLVALCAPIISASGITIMIQKAIPCKADITKIPERILKTSLFAGILLMLFCLFIITPLQHYAMPKLGYTRCNILKGHPNIYYSDWVKNPDWCVRGKSREWVKQQARLAGSTESNP